MIDFIHSISPTITSGIIVTLLTSWLIWRKREKLFLTYSITESNFFPFHGKEGKYFAIKISNNGGKIIKNIKVNFSITDAKIDSYTNHELISHINQNEKTLKFNIESLNPKENVELIITSSVSQTSKIILTARGEGVNAEEKAVEPSKTDIVGTAILFTFIGFLATVLLINVGEETESVERIDNVYSILNQSKMGYLFNNIVVNHDDITYRNTSYLIFNEYIKDTSKVDLEKYPTALKSISNIKGISTSSKGFAYYLIYKINKHENNQVDANLYLEKLKKECNDTYDYLMTQDKFYDVNELKKHIYDFK